MKKIILYIFVATIPLTMMAQDPKNAAAAQGLEKFKQWLMLQPRKDHIPSPADTVGLTLGNAVQTAIVPLDKLKQYQSGQPAEPLVNDVDEFTYPVLSGGNKTVSGTLTVSKKGDQWTTSRLGADQQAIQDATEYLSVPGRSYRLVKVLAFHLRFLSYTDAGTLMFIPLQDDAGREISKGKTITAQSVLEKYAKAANDYNGLPM